MNKKRWIQWSGGLVLCFLFIFSISIAYGSVDIDWVIVWKVIFHHLFGSFFPIEVNEVSDAIVWKLRVPRTLLAAMVGSMLAVAGVILQGLLKNPLADPYILGISSGASIGAVVAILFSGNLVFLGIWQIPLFAFFGSCLSLILLFYLVDQQVRTQSLILAGIIINSLFGAILTFLLSLAPQELPEIHYWLMGSFSLKEWDHLWIVFPVSIVPLFAWVYSRELNLLFLGDQRASHLGLSVKKMRWLLLLIASLLTAVSVAVAGMIGFVGIVIPHILRLLTGANHRILIPLAALAGAVFLMFSDWLARILLEPQELPVGVITACLGTPFFAWIFKRKQQQ